MEVPIMSTNGLTPMESEFYGPSNKYDYLPDEKMQPYFQNLHPPTDGIVTKRYKLHVTNIPTSLNHHGLRNIFQKFGQVVDTYIHTPPGLTSEAKRWGFVYYGSHLAAQQAINNIDRAEPLKLNVRYALSDEQLAARKAEQEAALLSAGQHNDEIMAFIQQCRQPNGQGPKKYSTVGRGGQLSQLSQEHRLPYQPSNLLRPEPKFVQESYSSAVEEQEEALVQPRAPRFVMRPEIDPATLKSKQFGVRHVLPKIPSKVCEFCGQSGRVRCSRCRSWYCGQKCQLEDWPVHKLECVAPPPLEYPDGTPVPAKIRNPKSPQPPAPLKQVPQIDVGKPLATVTEQPSEPEPCSGNPLNIQQLEKPCTPYNALHQAIAKPVVDAEKKVPEKKDEEDRETQKTPTRVKVTETSQPESKIVNQTKPEVDAEKKGPRKNDKEDRETQKTPTPVKVTETSQPEPKIMYQPKPEVVKESVPKVAESLTSKKREDPIQVQKELVKSPEPNKKEDPMQGQKELVKSPEPEKVKDPSPSLMPPKKVRIPENTVMKSPDKKKSPPESGIKPKEDVAIPPKTPMGEDKWKQTIMKDLISQKGTIQNLFVFTKSESDDVDLDSFGVMLIVDEHIEFILEEIVQEISGQKALEVVQVGDLVIVTAPGQEEEFAYRGLVLATKDTMANVLLIDYGVCNKYEISHLFPSTPKVKGFPSLGFRLVPSEPLTPEMKALIRAQLVAEANICLGQIADFVSKCDNEIDHAKIILMNGDDKLAGFEAHPAYQIDERAERLAGWEKSMPILANLGGKPIQDNAEVMMSSYDETTDRVVVQEVKDLLNESPCKIDLLLEKELSKFKVPILDPRKGCLVACKWSEEDRFYRGLILSVDPNRKKVKVRFIDYGNTAIEGFNKLAKLPSVLLDPKYPPLAHLVQLDGVPSLNLADPIVTVGVKHIAPQLEVPLTVKMVKSDGEIPLVKLVHPSKNTINELLTAKLKEGDSVQGNMQGKVVGGNFDYDICHIAALPVTINEVQSVFVLHVESPYQIFVCPASQIGLYEKIDAKVNEYCQELALSHSHLPRCNHVCLAKASDEAWYRAVCLQDLGDDLFNMFFPDLGYTEQVPSSKMTGIIDVLMEIPFLANHCTLFDLEGKDISKEGNEKIQEVLSELLPPFSELQILLKSKNDSVYQIQIPEHQTRIDTVIKEIEGKEAFVEKVNKAESPTSQAERDRIIAELEAKLAQLKG